MTSHNPLLGFAAATLVAAIAGAPSTPVQAQRPPRPILLAMVQDDAILLPFASWSAGRWNAPDPMTFDRQPSTWPGAWFLPWFDRSNAAVTPPAWSIRFVVTGARNVDAVTAPRREAMWSANAGAPVAVGAGCEGMWGLTSDVPSPTAPGFGGGLVGVAATDGLELAPFTRSLPSDPIDAATRFLFEAEETAAVGARPDHVFPSAAARRALPLEAEIFTGRVGNGRTLRFIRALRQYPAARLAQRPECGSQGLLNLVILETEGQQPVILERRFAILSLCDDASDSPTRPMTSLQLEGRTFVIGTVSGYESRAFAIFELTGRQFVRRLAVDGGGC
jgi:hypothetical protein